MATQQIRFATAADGVRLAWATAGEGPPLVKAANWLNHLEFDWQSPVWRHWLERLCKRRTLIRYDERGNGLSDWDAETLTLDAFVNDLETVVDAAGLDRFALLGISQGAAVGLAYAVRHPDRLTHLVLLGGYARGWARRDNPAEVEAREALLTLSRLGWGRDHPAFRQLWSSLYAPGATGEQMQWFNDLQRVSTSAENAVRLQRAFGHLDVTPLLARVSTPTLVLHARGDVVIPFDEGRLLASAIPGARFVELDTRNHIILPGEPAGERFIAEVDAFLDHAPAAAAAGGAGRIPVAPPQPAHPRTIAPGTIAPGTILGHYEVIDRLGRGGMGEVFRARDRRLGRQVAIKLVDRVTGGDGGRQEALREARVAAGLSHPRICTVFDVADTPGASFIVMELVEGRTLDTIVREGPVRQGDLVAWGIQIAEAVEHAHERGVLHRDLKSANVMIDAGGRVKVLDFGLASHVPSPEAETMWAGPADSPGLVAGTLAYMAPEALRGREADARTDIWSLGVVLYEMAAGTLPFHGRTPFELTSAILERPPAALPPAVPAPLARVVKRCLQKAPARRFKSATELRRSLAGLVAGEGATDALQTPRRRASSRTQRRAPEAAPPAAADPAVSRLMLRGRHFWNRRTEDGFRQALAVFQEAIDLDPAFAPAYVGLADCFNMLANYGFAPASECRPRARAAAERALAIEPRLADAHRALALVRWQFEWDWNGAESSYRESIRLDPASSLAHHWFGTYLAIVGRFDEGAAVLERAETLDPLALAATAVRGWVSYFAGDYETAIPHYRRVLDIDPRHFVAHWFMGQALVELRRFDEGLAELEAAARLSGRISRMLAYLGHGYARAGRIGQARDLLEELRQRADEGTFVSPYFPALVHAGLGENDAAIDWLERAYADRDAMVRDLRIDPSLAATRRDPRVQDLLVRIGFPPR